jgi:hypothetical protein
MWLDAVVRSMSKLAEQTQISFTDYDFLKNILDINIHQSDPWVRW